jgi:hypothetical protein
LHIIWSLLKHFLFGPQRKSWGYRMTFVSELAEHNSRGSKRWPRPRRLNARARRPTPSCPSL